MLSPSSSTSDLLARPCPESPPPKDFSAAFIALSNTYGIGNSTAASRTPLCTSEGVPTPVHAIRASKRPTNQAPKSRLTPKSWVRGWLRALSSSVISSGRSEPRQTIIPKSRCEDVTEKDYEREFGALETEYAIAIGMCEW